LAGNGKEDESDESGDDIADNDSDAGIEHANTAVPSNNSVEDSNSDVVKQIQRTDDSSDTDSR